MACANCNNTNPLSVYNIQYLYSDTCSNACSEECGNTYLNSKCLFYGGVSLTCSEIDNGDNLEIAIQKIDEKLCSVTGSYNTFNFFCLDDTTAITTEQGFVEAASEAICDLKTNLVGLGVQMDENTTDILNVVNNNNHPGITSCAAVGLIPADTVAQSLTKISTKLCEVYTTHLNFNSVTWNNCLSVSGTPITVPQALQILADQVCEVKTIAEGTIILPVFNNVGSCLAAPGATDTLSATVTKIKDRLCLSPVLDNDNLSSTCISIPTADNDLETLLQNMLDKIDTLSQAIPTFDSGDFDITPAGDPCDGVAVSLSTSPTIDRYVATTVGDTSPGVLADKIIAGSNVSLDTISSPGEMIINATFTDTNDKLKAFASDPNPSNYLDTKIEANNSDGVNLNFTNNIGTGKVTINTSLDWAVFIPSLVEALNASPELLAELCLVISGCPGVGGTSDDCTYYQVENPNIEEPFKLTYDDCISGSTIDVEVLPSSTVEICAQSSTVVLTGALTATALGSCSGGTTTTTTTASS